MSVIDVDKARVSGSDVVAALRDSSALDELMTQVTSGHVELSGNDGLLTALIREGLETGLRAELTDHLGYEARGRYRV